MKPPRLFLALSAEPLAPALKPLLKKLKENLDRREITARWVPSELLHVTILFFGETSLEKRDTLISLFDEQLPLKEAFTLKIEGLNAFNSPDEARVLWMGVQNSRRLRGLRSDLIEPLAALGWPLSEDYEPHLTIGRLRNPHGLRDLIAQFRGADLGKIAVKELVLFESVLQTPFPQYKIVRSWPLAEPAAAASD